MSFGWGPAGAGCYADLLGNLTYFCFVLFLSAFYLPSILFLHHVLYFVSDTGIGSSGHVSASLGLSLSHAHHARGNGSQKRCGGDKGAGAW